MPLPLPSDIITARNRLASLAGILLLPVLFISLSGCISTPDGGELFRRHGCINCHSVNGTGGRIGPDLTAVANRRSSDWIHRYLNNPAALNPAARMPAFPELGRMERQALIDYLSQ